MTQATAPAATPQNGADLPIGSSVPGMADLLSLSPEDAAKVLHLAESGTTALETPQSQQPQPAATPQQAPQAQPQPQATPQDPGMPDAVNAPGVPQPSEAERLEAEFAAMMAGTTPAQPPAPGQPQAPAASQTPPEQMVQDPETGQQVPLSALLAIREENRKLKEENLKLQGYKEAASQFSPQGARQPATKTPQDQIAELNEYSRRVSDNFTTQVEKLAELYDKGDISYVDLVKKQNALRVQTDDIMGKITGKARELERVASAPTPEQVQQMAENDPYLVSNTNVLVQQNPWINNLPEAAFENLRLNALDSMKQMGLPVDSSVQSIWNLRQAMVNVGRNFGYDRAFAQPAQGQPQAPQQAPAAQQQQAPVMQPPANPLAVTAQQRANKLQLANSHPPSPSWTGATSPQGVPGMNGMTPNIEGMTPLQIANALPKDTVDRLAFGEFA